MLNRRATEGKVEAVVRLSAWWLQHAVDIWRQIPVRWCCASWLFNGNGSRVWILVGLAQLARELSFCGLHSRKGNMTESSARRNLAQALQIIGAAQMAGDVESCCRSILPHVLTWADCAHGFILISDPRLPSECLVSTGLLQNSEQHIRSHQADWLDDLSIEEADPYLFVTAADHRLVLLPLIAHDRVLGMVGFASTEAALPDAELSQILSVIGTIIDCLAIKVSMERKLLHFDTFLDVSSLLARPVGLSESLDIALFSSMNAVCAEAASILLLDEAKETFRFFHVEGAARTLLGDTTFDATAGVAGRVLQTQEAEIVNDAAGDEQFYARIDADTGFQTRNLIAVPLLAGSEPIGVLEVLNRSGNEPFTADDRLILISVADQIAYAIRNAQIFECVVEAYCLRRQGNSSCEGCPQPLEGWDACHRYRQQSR